jgi:kynurenine formamidase
VKGGSLPRLGLNLDENGPQRGLFGGRWNPLHQMLATGTDAMAGKHDVTPGLRYADDAINLPTQAATQWDALSHVFLGDKMWNGYPASLVDSRGAHKNGIEKFANKMVGRGVLLDVARHKGVDCLDDGYPITVADLDETAHAQGVEVRRADFVIVRTGQMEDRLRKGEWGGYAGGPAPGLAFETLDWIHGRQIAGICSDTWGSRSALTTPSRTFPALALGHDPRDRHRPRRDLLSRGTRRRLRGRPRLRVLLLRAAAGHYPRHRLADQPPGDQVSSAAALARGGHGLQLLHDHGRAQ